jgi:hypothetical protein
MFPTLWLLNKSLGGDKITQGYAVASFSGGRVLMSPVLGKMSGENGQEGEHGGDVPFTFLDDFLMHCKT